MEEIELLDIADDLLVINKITIERLFQIDNQSALILYLFYYKTAKWQKTNPIKASDEYCKKCLHWGIDKLQATKKALKDMNLIETIRKTDNKGIVVGWYIKVNYLVDDSRIPKTTIPISPQLDKQETNTINNNIEILNNNKNGVGIPVVYPDKNRIDKNSIDNKQNRFVPPTLDEVKDYCLNVRHNNVDYQKFYDFYSVGEWKDSKGNKIKNWKQKVITWESKEPKKKKEFKYETI